MTPMVYIYLQMIENAMLLALYPFLHDWTKTQ